LLQSIDTKDLSLNDLRNRIRTGSFQGQTSGLANGYLQGNLIILPHSYAFDFMRFCMLNPQPCPLVSMGQAGDPHLTEMGADIDVRTDVPMYRIWQNGNLIEEVSDIKALWRNDLVAFVLGCSFSFEEALLEAQLEVRHIKLGLNVPMFETNIATVASGPFSGPTVVTMRPYKAQDAIRAIQITTRFPRVHGAPLHFGDPSQIGIKDLQNPEYGDAVPVYQDEVPVFWGCGVTPQAALRAAKLPFCITHSPGCMLITNRRNTDFAVL